MRQDLYPTSSVSKHLASNVRDRAGDEELNDKVIVVITVGMLHRDDIYRQAKRLGAHLIFVNNAIVEWAREFAADWIFTDDATDTNKVLSALSDYQIAHPTIRFDGIVTFDEYAVVCASEVASAYGLPGGEPAVMREVKNKYTFRLATQKTGVPTPQVMHFRQSDLDRGLYDEALSSFPFPGVLKPTSGAGSQFVRKIVSIADLKRHLYDARVAAAKSGLARVWDPSNERDCADSAFMLEEMLVGQEVDIDMLVVNGDIKFFCISDNFPTEGPENLFMESGGACPSLLPLAAQEAIEDTTRKTIATFGTALTGCFHFEVIVSPNKDPHSSSPYIAFPVELNLRLGGSEVLVLVLATYDVHLGVQALKIACGIPLESAKLPVPAFRDPTVCQSQGCSVNFLASDSGYVSALGFLPAATNDVNFAGCMTRVTAHSPIRAPPLAFDFIGWAVATGPNFEQSMKNLKRFASMFFCDITPFSRDDPLGLVPGTNVYYKDYILNEKKKNDESAKKQPILRLVPSQSSEKAPSDSDDMGNSTRDLDKENCSSPAKNYNLPSPRDESSFRSLTNEYPEQPQHNQSLLQNQSNELSRALTTLQDSDMSSESWRFVYSYDYVLNLHQYV